MEKARSMLSGAGLAQKLWAEVVETECYLLNRTPTSALVDFGLVRNPLSHILDCLGVMLLCMFQRIKGASSILKRKNVSSLVTRME